MTDAPTRDGVPSAEGADQGQVVAPMLVVAHELILIERTIEFRAGASPLRPFVTSSVIA